MRKCRFCGENVNTNNGLTPIAEPRQTVDDVRRLLGPATYVLTFGGYVSADCWLEHVESGLRYVQYQRVNRPEGPALVQEPYPDDKFAVRGPFLLGVFPIVASEYALAGRLPLWAEREASHA